MEQSKQLRISKLGHMTRKAINHGGSLMIATTPNSKVTELLMDKVTCGGLENFFKKI
jgi:hypothetical protein